MAFLCLHEIANIIVHDPTRNEITQNFTQTLLLLLLKPQTHSKQNQNWHRNSSGASLHFDSFFYMREDYYSSPL